MKIFPTFIDPENEELLALANSFIESFQAAEGKILADLEVDLESGRWGNHPLRRSLSKLLFDRCGTYEDDDSVAEQRWRMIKEAETLRTKESFPTFVAFQYELAKRIGCDVQALRENLYSDLPEFRRLNGFKSLAASALLHRLNCAQIQGLLVHAINVKLTLKASVTEKRRFFRCLKFQRLLSQTVDTDDGLHVELSGPMQIFQNIQSYGLRLANFFPYVLQLPIWQLSAEIKLGSKKLNLNLSDNVKIKSHYRELTPFIPPELTAFIENFNRRGYGWNVDLSNDYINLGSQSYCFPDIVARAASGEVIHIELFHKWHAGQFLGRLQAAESSCCDRLILGVAEDLCNSGPLEATIKNSTWFARHGFIFKAFPTPKSVFTVLSKNSNH